MLPYRWLLSLGPYSWIGDWTIVKMFKPYLSTIMREAHMRARDDYNWSKVHEPAYTMPYSYYLGLQLRNGFAEYRIRLTGFATITFAGIGANERFY